jgi:hypothetical protein
MLDSNSDQVSVMNAYAEILAQAVRQRESLERLLAEVDKLIANTTKMIALADGLEAASGHPSSAILVKAR